MVEVVIGAILTAIVVIVFLGFFFYNFSKDEADGIFTSMAGIVLAICAAAWMQYGINRHWENYLTKHGRGEFVQKTTQSGFHYLEFQLVPSIEVTKEKDEANGQ